MESLRKVLELERAKGFADTAVIGGLDGFLRRLLKARPFGGQRPSPEGVAGPALARLRGPGPRRAPPLGGGPAGPDEPGPARPRPSGAHGAGEGPDAGAAAAAAAGSWRSDPGLVHRGAQGGEPGHGDPSRAAGRAHHRRPALPLSPSLQRLRRHPAHIAARGGRGADGAGHGLDGGGDYHGPPPQGHRGHRGRRHGHPSGHLVGPALHRPPAAAGHALGPERTRHRLPRPAADGEPGVRGPHLRRPDPHRAPGARLSPHRGPLAASSAAAGQGDPGRLRRPRAGYDATGHSGAPEPLAAAPRPAPDALP